MRLVQAQELLLELRRAGLAEAVCGVGKGVVRGGAIICKDMSHQLIKGEITKLKESRTFRPREVLLGRVQRPDLCHRRLEPGPRLGGGGAGVACGWNERGSG